MSKLQEYYRSIRQRQTELSGQFPDGSCLVVSKECVCEVPVTVAARLLVEGTHKLASEQEACAFRATQAMNRATTPLVDSLANARQQFAALLSGKDKSK